MSDLLEDLSLVGFAGAGFIGAIALSAFGRMWPDYFWGVVILFLLAEVAAMLFSVACMGISASKAEDGVNSWVELLPAAIPGIIITIALFVAFLMGVWVGR